jgi:agmatinase
MIKAREFDLRVLKEKLDKLRKKAYVSIDADVFDLSVVRNTGTPEPGGLSWQQVVDALKLIFSEKEVIGADIVEFAPNTCFEAEAYSLAKLAHKMMGMKRKSKQFF